MTKRSLLTVAGAVAALALLVAQPAFAATEFGDNCAANAGASTSYTLTTLESPVSAPPLTAPSGGVITKVKVSLGLPIPVPIPTAVKVLRSAGGNNYTVVGQQSVSATIGISTADARIPVQPGDRLAVHGEPFLYEGESLSLTLYCAEYPGTLGAVIGDVPVGSTANFTPVTTARVPAAAVIEPDVDGDGYGDETQDACPQSAALQSACPEVKVDLSSAIKRKRSAVVLVTTSSEAPVTVSGIVGLGKGRKARLSGGTHVVKPGAVRRFALKFPKKLTKKLRKLRRSKLLRLRVTASATDLIGRVSKDRLKVGLRGQRKKAKHKKG